MAKAVLLLCALALTNASPSLVGSEDALNFAKGFITGFEADPSSPSQCATDLISALSKADVVLSDISLVLSGEQGAFTQLVLDLQQASSIFAPLATECDLSGLENVIASLWSINGVNIVVENYFKNIKLISQSLENYQTCTDYTECGLYAGETVKYLINWSLNTQVPGKFESSSAQDTLAFLQGLLTGLQANSNSQCYADLSIVLTNSDALIVDIESVMNGGYSGIIKLTKDLQNFSSQLPSAIGQLCNTSGLISSITALLGPDGMNNVEARYFIHRVAINQDIVAIATCDQDYSACGKASGEIIRFITAWGI